MAQFLGRRTSKFDSDEVRGFAGQWLPSWGAGHGAVPSGEGAPYAYWDVDPDGTPRYKAFSQGDEVTGPSAVPFFAGNVEGGTPWMQDTGALVANAQRKGALTPQKFVEVFNQNGYQPNAAVNPDGSISYDLYSFDDEEGFLDKFMNSPMAPVAMFGGLLGAVGGFGSLFSGAGGASGALGELGINTALAAGEVGGIAAGTSIADLAGGYSLSGSIGATVDATAGSFSDILANYFSPKNIAINLAKQGVISAVTGRDITAEGLATGLISGAAGTVADAAAGGGLIGDVAKTAVGYGTQAAIGGLIDPGGRIGNTAPRSAPVSPAAITAATPNEVPMSFSLGLSAFQPQFKRNT